MRGRSWNSGSTRSAKTASWRSSGPRSYRVRLSARSRCASIKAMATRVRSRLLRAVVRCLFRDRDVVHVALAEAGRRHANQLRVALQLGDVGAAAVAHSRAQAADQLMNHRGHAALVRHAALDPLRHQLLARCGRCRALEIEVVLEIPIAAAAAHRADRPHAAVLLEAAALIQDQLARTLV